jgi:asparagine synthase (glutamine-hydrolysing)
MCGICGIYKPKSKVYLLDEVKKMNDLLHHRGPDDEGYFESPGIALGHKRLSIIDLQTGKQPIYNEDGSIVIVYNGELYNYKDLRKDLISSGHRFTTKTDTEVIVHSYEEYGTDCVKKFNGMFAFAIWDQNLKRLFLSRDRLGIKPLYYYWDAKRKQLAFASEIKALLIDPLLKRKLNWNSLADYLVFQNILDDKTFFKTINILLPGHKLTVTDEILEVYCYWNPTFTKRYMVDDQEYLQAFRHTLKSSVDRQLMSDVPVGAYLSGGFDSSSVATYAAELNGGRLDTFTGYFDEGEAFDERNASTMVADNIKATSHQVAIKQSDFESSIFDIIYHMDEPRVGPGVFPQYHVSRLVSKHVKVVLTGHGGDELFCGYPFYKMNYLSTLIRRNPFHIITLLRNLKRGEEKSAIVNILLPFFYPEMGLGMNLSIGYGKWKNLLGLKDKNNNYDPLDTLHKLLDQAPNNKMDAIQFLYLKTYLPALFIVEDKVGMAHSIEARLPICDNEMVDFALSVPFEEKLKNYELKYVIKEAMRKKLPDVLYRQPKMGFPTPLAKWFKDGLKDFLQKILLDERCLDRGVFNPDVVKKTVSQHVKGRRNRQHLLWKMLNVEVWHRVFLDSDNWVPVRSAY